MGFGEGELQVVPFVRDGCVSGLGFGEGQLQVVPFVLDGGALPGGLFGGGERLFRRVMSASRRVTR